MENKVNRVEYTAQQQWDDFGLTNQDLFESYDQYMKCVVFWGTYRTRNKETFETERAKYNSFREFHRNFLVPLFFNSLNS